MRIKITSPASGLKDNCIEPDGLLIMVGKRRAVYTYRFGQAVFSGLMVPSKIEIEVVRRMPLIKPFDLGEYSKICRGADTYFAWSKDGGLGSIDLSKIAGIDQYLIDSAGPVGKVKNA